MGQQPDLGPADTAGSALPVSRLFHVTLTVAGPDRDLASAFSCDKNRHIGWCYLHGYTNCII